MKKLLILLCIIALLFAGCAKSTPGASTPGNDNTTAPTSAPSDHDHTPASERIAEGFVVHAEPFAEITEHSICYQEPDGCLTKIVDLGAREQPLIIHDEKIYFTASDMVKAVDFSGQTASSIQIDCRQSIQLVYTDEAYLYGGGPADSDMVDLFQVNWALSEYQKITAMPKEFRKLDFTLLENDLREAAGAADAEVLVYQASVQYDTNGMIKSIIFAISFPAGEEVNQGILLFSWRNQDIDYHIPMNPWFNPMEEPFDSAENVIPLSRFLGYLQEIEAADLIVTSFPQVQQDYFLTLFDGAIIELHGEETVLPSAEIFCFSLKNGQAVPTELPDPLPEGCLIVKSYGAGSDIDGILYILI